MKCSECKGTGETLCDGSHVHCSHCDGTGVDPAQKEALRPLLNKEFLDTLAEATRVCGWDVDMIESRQFVVWCYELAGIDPPNLEAYER